MIRCRGRRHFCFFEHNTDLNGSDWLLKNKFKTSTTYTILRYWTHTVRVSNTEWSTSCTCFEILDKKHVLFAWTYMQPHNVILFCTLHKSLRKSFSWQSDTAEINWKMLTRAGFELAPSGYLSAAEHFQVNIFQLTSTVLDYHEKLSLHVSLRMILKFTHKHYYSFNKAKSIYHFLFRFLELLRTISPGETKIICNLFETRTPEHKGMMGVLMRRWNTLTIE